MRKTLGWHCCHMSAAAIVVHNDQSLQMTDMTLQKNNFFPHANVSFPLFISSVLQRFSERHFCWQRRRRLNVKISHFRRFACVNMCTHYLLSLCAHTRHNVSQILKPPPLPRNSRAICALSVRSVNLYDLFRREEKTFELYNVSFPEKKKQM